jgi:hypothetical protein
MNNPLYCIFVNIFIYLLPCDLFKILSCSIDDRKVLDGINTLGSCYSRYCTFRCSR